MSSLNWDVCDGIHLDEQERVRKFADGDSCSSRTSLIEVLAPDPIKVVEVLHSNQKASDVDQILQVGAGITKDVTNVLNDRTRLYPNVEPRDSRLILLCTRNTVIRQAGTYSRNKKEVSRTDKMWETAERFRLAGDDSFHGEMENSALPSH